MPSRSRILSLAAITIGAGVGWLAAGDRVAVTDTVMAASEPARSDDEIDGIPGILIRGKNNSIGLGPEVTLTLVSKRKVFGFLTARYFWETYARTTTQGNAFLINATFLTKPIQLPTK